jgi:hypothetical protein
MKQFLTLVIIFVYSLTNAQTNKQIIDSLLIDTANMSQFYKIKQLEIIRLLQSDSAKHSYPFCEFDKVIGYRINEGYTKSKNDKNVEWCIVDKSTKKLVPFYKQVKLDNVATQKLISFINNPLHFDYGAVSTVIPELGFVFYKNDSIVAYLDLGCGFNQVNFIYPSSILIKEGSVDPKFRTEFKNFLFRIKMISCSENG